MYRRSAAKERRESVLRRNNPFVKRKPQSEDGRLRHRALVKQLNFEPSCPLYIHKVSFVIVCSFLKTGGLTAVGFRVGR